MYLLAVVILLTVLGLVKSTPVSDLDKRQGQLYSLMVAAPPENISPKAAEIAASLNGQVCLDHYLQKI